MPNINNQKSFKELQVISKKLRKKIIETGFNSKIPHIGSCLSCLDLLVYLYWNQLKIDPEKPTAVDRDRFLLSKGHGAPALFQVLAERGFFEKERLFFCTCLLIISRLKSQSLFQQPSLFIESISSIEGLHPLKKCTVSWIANR